MPEERKNKISCSEFNYEMEVALEVISGKWKVAILWNLFGLKVINFNQFLKVVPGVTQKMLTQQLRALEKDKLICRKVIPSVPPVVEYSLTPLAHEVIPILDELNKFGRKVLKSHVIDVK